MKSDLHQVREPGSKYLVYTSAGDNANLSCWAAGSANFDLWITYYGDEAGKYSDQAHFYNERKGSKFQNLHHVYKNWPDLLAQYEAIMVMDDDIIIDAYRLSILFDIRNELDIWALQPAFEPCGRVSHPITKVNHFYYLRYTNFIEMTCPLFKKEKLDKFMKVYDPELVGWGVDWWFLNSLNPREFRGKIAVVDVITCINPHNETKSHGREIERVQSSEERLKMWKKIRKERNLLEWRHETYSGLYDKESILEEIQRMDPSLRERI